jgi:putative NADPH-quinone reductase
MLAINGHPDPRPERFCAALCAAYVVGAQSAGLTAHDLTLGDVPGFGDLRYAQRGPSMEIENAFKLLDWADRVLVAFPLWLDKPPPTLRRFFGNWTNRMGGASPPPSHKNVTLLVTMSMPAFAHRAAARRLDNPVNLAGASDAEHLYVGCVDSLSAAQRLQWLDKLRDLGGAAAARSSPAA